MPKANIHYHFEKDAVIDTVYQIAFEGKEADWANDRIGSNVYEGVVGPVNIDDQVEVAVEVAGDPGGGWSRIPDLFGVSGRTPFDNNVHGIKFEG